MPIYVFRCEKCLQEFECFMGMTQDRDEMRCPLCGNREVQRVFSMFGISSSPKEFTAGKQRKSCGSCTGGYCSTCS